MILKLKIRYKTKLKMIGSVNSLKMLINTKSKTTNFIRKQSYNFAKQITKLFFEKIFKQSNIHSNF